MHGLFGSSGNGGGGGLPERRGTRLASELDARLSGDAPLSDIIDWWSEEWGTAMGVQLEFSSTDEDPGIEALQPKNFSRNELMVFVISALNGCYVDSREAAGMPSFWPMSLAASTSTNWI
jgi:hypothetical protein